MAGGKKILILEDERVLGEILNNKLLKEGYDASWVMDGEEGMKQMTETKPDLILLDIVMPKKDGYQVLEEMQKDATLKKIPVIVISNSGQPVEIERIVKLGVKDYIVKAQFSPDEVMAKVKKYLEPQSAEAGTNKSVKGLKILIVEDDPFLAALALKRLQQEGYDVRNAADGSLGIQAMQESVPDLVLLDIIMPVMNGFDVLKKMKADDKLKNIPVIIFSNLGQEQEVEEGKKLGADDFLVKAKFTLREVVEKIAELLKRKGKL